MLHAVGQVAHYHFEFACAEYFFGSGSVGIGHAQGAGRFGLEMLRGIGEGKFGYRHRLCARNGPGGTLVGVLHAVVFEIALEEFFRFAEIGFIHIAAGGVPAAVCADEQRGAASAHGVQQVHGALIAVFREFSGIQRRVDEQLQEKFVGLALVFQDAGQVAADIGCIPALNRLQKAAFGIFKQHIQQRMIADGAQKIFGHLFRHFDGQRGHLFIIACGNDGFRGIAFEHQFQFALGELHGFILVAHIGMRPEQHGIFHVYTCLVSQY